MEAQTDNKIAIISKLNSIRAFAAILDTIYQPVDEMARERNCSLDEAIEYKTSADKYMKKCGATVIRRTINEVTELIK